jgi:penicillin-binding protein 2
MARHKIFGFIEGDALGGGLKVTRQLSQHEEWADAILPADADAGVQEGETNRRPLFGLAAVMVIAVGLLVARLFYLQIINGSSNLALANGNRVHERVARAPRGMIYDRNHVALARNQASFDITVIPQLLPKSAVERQRQYERVGGMIGLPGAEVAKRAEITCVKSKPEAGCLQTPIPQLVAANVPREQALLVDEASNSLPGFALDVNPIRQYLDGNLLSVFLGYTGRVSVDDAARNPGYGPTDLIGKLGLEKQYERELKGRNGGERTEVDALGHPVRVLASQTPVPGNNVVLSIDFALQQKLAEAITKQMGASGAKRASGVAMNPKTGEVLAAVSLPSYDNNMFSQGISQADYQRLVGDPGQPLFNKVSSGAYPSGSVIKPMTAAAGLQEGIINTSTIIEDKGQLDVVNPYDPSIHYIYKGWEHSGLGMMNVYSAIARSSDIFFYTMAGGFTNFKRYLGVEKLTQYYKLFGFGARTGVDVPGETAGRVPTPEWKKQMNGESWYTGDTYNISVGQGDILVSPLQMAMATSAVANGGILYTPYFVTRIEDGNGKAVKTTQPKIIRKDFISQNNLAVVRQAMRQTINMPGGTACCFIEQQVPVQVAGKTGSAETDPTNNVPPHSWFTAFAPFNDPQIVTVVLLEKSGEGSQYAAPATRETLIWYFTQGAGSKR